MTEQLNVQTQSTLWQLLFLLGLRHLRGPSVPANLLRIF